MLDSPRSSHSLILELTNTTHNRKLSDSVQATPSAQIPMQGRAIHTPEYLGQVRAHSGS